MDERADICSRKDVKYINPVKYVIFRTDDELN